MRKLLSAVLLFSTLTVVVEEAQLRTKPQFYAPAAGRVKLGQKLEGGSLSAGWYSVDGAFIHESAVTSKKVKLSGAKSVGEGGASAEEITLAGKGFNAEVEKSYRKTRKDVNFGAVDSMERRKASDGAMVSFLKAGGLL